MNGKTGASKMLRKAVELDPGFLKAQYRLGLSLMSEQDYQGALKHLLQVKSVDRQDAFMLFYSLAYAHQFTGNRPEALKALANAKKYAKSARETETADRLGEYLERASRPEAAQRAGTLTAVEPSGAAERPSDAGRPSLKRSGEGAETAAPAALDPPLPSIEGTLDQLDCLGNKARMQIRYQGRALRLVIVDPTSVDVQGAGGVTVDFTCGPQQARQVRITMNRSWTCNWAPSARSRR